MGIHNTRRMLYRIARILGDMQAVSSGNPKKMVKRVGRRVAGRTTGRALRRLFK